MLFVVGAFEIVIGLAAAFAVLYWMVRAHSPLTLIARDAVTIFISEPGLLALPLALAAACAACGGLVLLTPRWIEFLAFHWSTSLLSMTPAWMAPSFAAAFLAAFALAAVNAVLADCFLERFSGRERPLRVSAGRALLLLPRLIAFTALWFGLLLFVTAMRMELEWLLRRWRLKPVSLALDFASFALETGVVMAAYLLMVVMLREDLGPVAAMRRTLEVVRREYGRTPWELVRLKTLDESISLLMASASMVGIAAAFRIWDSWPTPRNDMDVAGLGVVLAMLSALAVGVGYYVMIQTVQMLLACAVFLYVHDGVLAPGFSAADFENALCLSVSALPAGVTGPERPAEGSPF